MGGTIPIYEPRYRTVRVWKGGNSFVVALPAVLCRALKLVRGDEMKVYVVGDVICLQPARGDSFFPHVVGVKAGRAPEEEPKGA